VVLHRSIIANFNNINYN